MLISWFLGSLTITSNCGVTCIPEIHPNCPISCPLLPKTRTNCPLGLKTWTRAFPESPTRINPNGSTATASGCLSCPLCLPTDPNSWRFSPSKEYILILPLPLSTMMTRSESTAMAVGAFSWVYLADVDFTLRFTIPMCPTNAPLSRLNTCGIKKSHYYKRNIIFIWQNYWMLVSSLRPNNSHFEKFTLSADVYDLWLMTQ